MQSSKKVKQNYQKKLKDFTTAHNLYIQNRKTNSLDSSKNAKLAYTIGEPPKRLEQFASFFCGLDYLALGLGSQLPRHYVKALECFSSDEFMDNDSLDKTRLIGALTTLIYAQNLPHHTKNTLYKYADFIILWNKSYEALKKHKDEISEYKFYSQHIQKPPEQINATHTIKTSPFSSLAAIEDSVMQNIREQARQEVEEEFRQKPTKSFIQILLEPRSYPNVLEVRRYIPVITEACFLFVYIVLAMFALNSLSSIREVLSSKNIITLKSEEILWESKRQVSTPKMLKFTAQFLLFVAFFLIVLWVALLMCQSGIFLQKLIGYFGVISTLSFMLSGWVVFTYFDFKKLYVIKDGLVLKTRLRVDKIFAFGTFLLSDSGDITIHTSTDSYNFDLIGRGDEPFSCFENFNDCSNLCESYTNKALEGLDEETRQWLQTSYENLLANKNTHLGFKIEFKS